MESKQKESELKSHRLNWKFCGRRVKRLAEIGRRMKRYVEIGYLETCEVQKAMN